MQHIKDSRSRTFAHKFNEQNLKVNQSNVKLLVKLEKAKPFTRYTSSDRSARATAPSFMNPATKRKVVET